MAHVQNLKAHGSLIMKYGITEKKKAELDYLANEVLDAQAAVAQYQAMVASLTEKSADFQGFLAVAEANKNQALSNRNLVDQVVQNASDLKNNSKTAFDEMIQANSSTKNLAAQTKTAMDKLIYCAEMINKLSNAVVRKKALNPLISNELVTLLGTAGKDANNAVALSLVALKSTFAAQATNIESEAATTLGYKQAQNLYLLLTSIDSSGKLDMEKPSLKSLLYDAYTYALDTYTDLQAACQVIITHLSIAQRDLGKAQIKLRSLQSGLAAGNAAALAS